jgi:diaminohydroxyphosphoribosylaminopyrimidine deaminase / 5-amino-6-(5-phosphoribosylamino)uracil reductase
VGEFGEIDERYMARALRLAAKGRGRTSPNPMVGAVVVRQGRVVAEDYHKRPGELHAEALALLSAGVAARNAVLYVTLEPCCHTDKRTPPCTRAIIAAGVKKVFTAMVDPNPKVSGKGNAELRKHGISVVEGVLAKEARLLNEAYVKFITTRAPFVILKIAMTLDGRIATPERQSKWITGEKARKIVHMTRASVDAVLTAIGTVRADDPELTVRIGKDSSGTASAVRQPTRIVIDPHLETPLPYKVFQTPPETIVVTRAGIDRDRSGKVSVLRQKGVEFIEYEGERVDLRWLVRVLGERGITSVMIEAGSSLNAHALNAGIVDKIMCFVAPKIIGGKDSIPAVGGDTFRRLEEAYTLRDVRVRRAGGDILIEGYVG